MARTLPPLNALRAFEVAARHGSFVAAAEELAVTPAAISHQVKGLEEHLGVPLFVRGHRSVDLTAAGRKLLPGLSQAFDRMSDAVAAVRPQDENAPVTITIGPSFAAKWLVPRLEGFMVAYPDYSVRVQADNRLVDLMAEEVDLAIRFSATGPALTADYLFRDQVFPVCAPVLRMALKAPANLSMQTLIYDDLFEAVPGTGTWADWMKVAGVPTLQPARRQHFSHTTLALDAAARGQGVALGRGSLVAQELKTGSLVRPFDTAVRADVAYHLVYRGDRPLRRAVAAFRDWVRQEAQTFREAQPKLVG